MSAHRILSLDFQLPKVGGHDSELIEELELFPNYCYSEVVRELLDFLSHWSIPKRQVNIAIDPQELGLRIGTAKLLLPWEEIKEVRTDFWLGRLDFFNKWYMGTTIVTIDSRKIYTNLLPETIVKVIMDKANLKKERNSFWFSQKIYSKY